MGGARAPSDELPPRRLRDRRAARRRGYSHARDLPLSDPPRVTLFLAEGCHLCEEARRLLEELRAELGFALELVDIAGDPVLEDAYRVLLPVVEIDGERAFVLEVDGDEARERLTRR